MVTFNPNSKKCFFRANCNAENVELFVNTLEALVETCLPIDEVEEGSNYDSLLSASSNVKLSSSLTSISLVSPTEKGAPNPF
jgi:neurofibromin 1